MLTARLGVKDLEKELRFYEALGFDVERAGSAARVRFHDAVFTLAGYEELRVKDHPLLDWEQHPPQYGTGVQLYILVPSVDDFAETIPVGIARPWPVRDKSWGLRELTLRTPSGYLVTFATRTR